MWAESASVFLSQATFAPLGRLSIVGTEPYRQVPFLENPMTATQTAKAERFVVLHQGPGAFVIANPWDAGSARLLAALGYQALATSSGASAGVLGRRDGQVTRDEALAQAAAIVAATELPVSADLEKGFGDAPADAAETIRLAAQGGLVGGAIED